MGRNEARGERRAGGGGAGRREIECGRLGRMKQGREGETRKMEVAYTGQDWAG